MAEANGDRDLRAALESLLCATGEPLPVERAAEAIGNVKRGDVVRALRALAAEYERDGRGFRIAEVAGGYQLRTAPEHVDCVRRLLRERPLRLTRPMLETLAIVAYKQPITKPEIELIRGVDADSVIGTLLDRGLIRVAGRKDAPGRPLLYATSRQFLEVFNLPSLAELPTLRELADLPVLAAPEMDFRAEGAEAGEAGAGNPADTDATLPAADAGNLTEGVSLPPAQPQEDGVDPKP